MVESTFGHPKETSVETTSINRIRLSSFVSKSLIRREIIPQSESYFAFAQFKSLDIQRKQACRSDFRHLSFEAFSLEESNSFQKSCTITTAWSFMVESTVSTSKRNEHVNN